MPLLAAASLIILLGVIDRRWLATAGFIGLIISLAPYFRVGNVRAEPLVVRPPVVGRWVPVNGPGTRVPSHGLHAWGQTYAVDLIHALSGDYRPKFGWSPLSETDDSFPSFGQPVVAPASGTVVRAYDKARDHRSRTSWPGLFCLLIEGALRELGGPKRCLATTSYLISATAATPHWRICVVDRCWCGLAIMSMPANNWPSVAILVTRVSLMCIFSSRIDRNL
jgi:hypothetical protein